MMINFVRREKLAKHVTFKIGGEADLYISVSKISELEDALLYAWRNNIPVFLLGSGSNILVSDEGFRGLVIHNKSKSMRLEEFGETAKLYVDSGVILDEVTKLVIEKGWAGLEWAVGIPGTIGAAIITNAGTSSGAISDILNHITVLTTSGYRELRTPNELELSYRNSIYRKDWSLRKREVILSAEFTLHKGDCENLFDILKRRIERRRSREPREPNIGSIFKNPPQAKVRELIGQIGLKGYRIGNAQISEVAPSFIINLGNATAEDVLELICLMKDEVNKHYGIKLDPEVEFVGEWSEALDEKINLLYGFT